MSIHQCLGCAGTCGVPRGHRSASTDRSVPGAPTSLTCSWREARRDVASTSSQLMLWSSVGVNCRGGEAVRTGAWRHSGSKRALAVARCHLRRSLPRHKTRAPQSMAHSRHVSRADSNSTPTKRGTAVDSFSPSQLGEFEMSHPARRCPPTLLWTRRTFRERWSGRDRIWSAPRNATEIAARPANADIQFVRAANGTG